jgi:hypothetical protein
MATLDPLPLVITEAAVGLAEAVARRARVHGPLLQR